MCLPWGSAQYFLRCILIWVRHSHCEHSWSLLYLFSAHCSFSSFSTTTLLCGILPPQKLSLTICFTSSLWIWHVSGFFMCSFWAGCSLRQHPFSRSSWWQEPLLQNSDNSRAPQKLSGEFLGAEKNSGKVIRFLKKLSRRNIATSLPSISKSFLWAMPQPGMM